MRVQRRIPVVAMAALGLTFAFSSPALADDSTRPAGAPVGTNALPPPDYYQLLDKRTVSTDYTNRSNEIGSCRVLTSGASCTVTTSVSATVSVGLDLGASRGFVTGALNITSATSVSSSASCTSPALPAGSTFRAWPRGTQYSYKLRHFSRSGGVSTSGTLSAFVPRQNAITCG